MAVLRFFFMDRFTRFDVLVIITVSALYSTERIGVAGALLMLFAGFAAGGVGGTILARKNNGSAS